MVFWMVENASNTFVPSAVLVDHGAHAADLLVGIVEDFRTPFFHAGASIEGQRLAVGMLLVANQLKSSLHFEDERLESSECVPLDAAVDAYDGGHQLGVRDGLASGDELIEVRFRKRHFVLFDCECGCGHDCTAADFATNFVAAASA